VRRKVDTKWAHIEKDIGVDTSKVIVAEEARVLEGLATLFEFSAYDGDLQMEGPPPKGPPLLVPSEDIGDDEAAEEIIEIRDRLKKMREVQKSLEQNTHALVCQPKQDGGPVAGYSTPSAESKANITKKINSNAALAGKELLATYQQNCEKIGLRAKPSLEHNLTHIADALKVTPIGTRTANMARGTKTSKRSAGPTTPHYLGNRGALALIEALPAVRDTCKSIDLSGNGLGNEAAKLLAEMLPELPYVKSVNLSENNISNLGAQALLNAFKAHPALVQLQLDLNPLPSYLRVKISQEAARKRERATEEEN
jgi:hypothetical protein